jgi:hypothetical protein
MPCYTAWNQSLTPGTPKYLQAEEQVREKLKAVMHIVDYYYKAFEYSMPDLPDGVSIDSMRQPRSEKEMSVREMICYHFACDGISFLTLYDVCSLLESQDKLQRPYLAIILPCAYLMRASRNKFRLSS